MAKVGGVNRTGQVNTILETPSEQLAQATQGATPQATGNPFDAVMQDAPQENSQGAIGMLDEIEGVTFDDPYAEERAAEELPRVQGDPEMDEAAQRVVPISERDEGNKWGYRKSKVEIDPHDADGGFTSRIMGVAQSVGNSQVADHSLTFSPGSNLGKITNKIGANTSEYGQQNMVLDDSFRYIVAARSEKFFADRMEGAKNDQMPMSEKQQFEQQQVQQPNIEIKKAEDSASLGHEIAREYQREVNARQGQPTDQYNDISDQEATVLGDYAKEAYAAALGDKVQRTVGDDDMVIFTLSPALVAELDSAKIIRDLYVPSQQVIDPLSTPEGEIKGEKRKYTKKIAGGLGKGVASSEAAQESLKNQGSIPHVVLPRRLKLLLGTLLPSLMAGPQQFNNPLVEMAAEINGFGNSKVRDLHVTAEIKQKAGEEYDMNNVLRMIKQGAANSMQAIAKGNNKLNFLTYYTQAFNGRQSPQQTHFNPTTSKIVRSVTGNAVPTIIKKDGKYFEAAIQSYAMLIGKEVDKVGLDAFLPEYRKNFLRTQAGGLEADGNRLLQVLDQSINDAQMKAMVDAINKGMAINDPNFPAPKLLALDPQADADLIKRIRDKGEDGIAYMDALMDFALFNKAMREGRSYPTYINPTIDGKTNGLAGIGLQLGIEELAVLTGVLRSPDAIHAVQNDHDIRDELRDILMNDLNTSKFEGTFKDNEMPALVAIASDVFNHRPLNKEVTMTFGYGKEIDSFISSILNTVFTVADKNPRAKQAQQYLNDKGWTDEKIARAILNKYIPAMAQVMSPDAMEARALHRGVALVHGIADELMVYTSATGDPLYMGGRSPEGRRKAGSYKMLNSEGEQVQRTANEYPSRSTSSASKFRAGKDGPWEDVGGKALSGSVVAPIQSIDAATVIKSFSGDSWSMLKKNVKDPYMHQIYDAFKMDVATFHHMLPEINNNWARIGLEWSALEQAKIALRKRAIPAWENKLRAMDKGKQVSLDEFPVIKSMLADEKGLTSRLAFLAPASLDSAQKAKWVKETAQRILRDSGAKLGQESMHRGQLHMFMQAILHHTNLDRRLSSAYKKAEQKRNRLKAKILNPNNNIAQYYAH